jgi:hypothetical protein
MGLFSTKAKASSAEARIAKLEEGQQKILAALGKLTGESPEETPKAAKPATSKPAAKKAAAPAAAEPEEGDEEEQEEPSAEEGDEEEQEEPSAEEGDEEEQEEPSAEEGDEEEKKTSKPSGKKAAVQPSNAAVMKELQALRKELAGSTQKREASSLAAKAGIKPIRRGADVKTDGTPTNADDPYARTRAAWGKTRFA